MVYQNFLVASIKCQNKILREHSNTIQIPFGSTYSILLKNVNSKRALASIYVDGKTVIEGLVLSNTDGTVEIERFLENDNQTGHKLKFIEKTDEISDHRGDDIEDGLVRIEYQYEQPYPLWGGGLIPTWTSDIHYRSTLQSAPDMSSQYTYSNDQGITVEGDYSNQKFQSGNIGLLENEKHIIVLNLKGFDSSQQPVKKATGSRDKVECHTCGKKWKSNHKFCGNCGTCLI